MDQDKPRCHKCFAPKTVESYIKPGILLCAGCRYKVMEIVNFLEYYGMGMNYALFAAAAEEPPLTPPSELSAEDRIELEEASAKEPAARKRHKEAVEKPDG